MTAKHLSPNVPSAASAAGAHALLDGGLSTASRFAHLALLIVALLMSVVLGSLWATEAALPPRTHVAFGALVLIGLGWAGFAAWVLTTRQVLLGQHRVVAGWLAVTFTSVFVVGSVVVGATTGQAAAYPAAALGAVMVAVAVVMLARARRAVAQLMTRRAQLERALAGRQ